MKKTAIVLLNLGGPNSLDAVKPFLFNLFNDRAIIDLPQPFRFALAKFISGRRDKKAQKIYAQIGGKSPLAEITDSQAKALEKELADYGDYKVFVAMRYWHPFSSEAISKIISWQADEIILLPLYPQYSFSTTGSSIRDFLENFPDKNFPIKKVCCYASDDDFIEAHANLVKQTLEKISHKNYRILFSAHGLPQKQIDKGDPYVFHVEESSNSVIERLYELLEPEEKIDYAICYQSKVGPLKWTSPSLDFEIRRCALDQKIPVVVPISFVSDHSETLVELDIDYKNLAQELGINEYHRVPSLNLDETYIKTLAKLCVTLADEDEYEIFCDENPTRICPKKYGFCPNKNDCAS